MKTFCFASYRYALLNYCNHLVRYLFKMKWVFMSVLHICKYCRKIDRCFVHSCIETDSLYALLFLSWKISYATKYTQEFFIMLYWYVRTAHATAAITNCFYFNGFFSTDHQKCLCYIFSVDQTKPSSIFSFQT